MRVLVVEDELAMVEALTNGLTTMGWSVEVATDGLDGLWLATERTYDVIVLDLMLPGMNGHDVCRNLRKAGIWTQVLVLTSLDGKQDEADVLDIGADDYLAKPFSFVVLAARLRALYRRGTAPRPATLSAGDLTLDPFSNLCTRGGTTIMLTTREAAVLKVLIRRGGQVVSKSLILDLVWGEDFPGDPNIVEVYVGHLRRKIDRPFEVNLLRTVRGVGYQLAKVVT
ncbi:MAG: response regulator transcription factor [Pseudonocardia sp.]|nr:response regulator transcription factor [Pseudonocardia sp.]